jgi:hypothetical protein
MGHGLSAFSSLESTLALIFARLIGCKRLEMALIAFDAINLTSPKLRVLRAVAKEHFDREALDPASQFKRLDRLLKRVEARAEFRIKLAHWTVSIPKLEANDRETLTVAEQQLVPPWFSAKNLMFVPKEGLSLAEIREFTRKTNEANRALVEYLLAIQETGLYPSRGSEDG